MLILLRRRHVWDRGWEIILAAPGHDEWAFLPLLCRRVWLVPCLYMRCLGRKYLVERPAEGRG